MNTKELFPEVSSDSDLITHEAFPPPEVFVVKINPTFVPVVVPLFCNLKGYVTAPALVSTIWSFLSGLSSLIPTFPPS